MRSLMALAILAVAVSIHPPISCEPADPSASEDSIRPYGAFPLGEFGMCTEGENIIRGDIVYRVLECEQGTVHVPMRYAPTPYPDKYKKPQLEARR